jgi:hypothetical protein
MGKVEIGECGDGMEGDGDRDLIYSRLVSYTVLWCKSGYTRCKLGICGVYLHRAVYYTPGLYLSECEQPPPCVDSCRSDCGSHAAV